VNSCAKTRNGTISKKNLGNDQTREIDGYKNQYHTDYNQLIQSLGNSQNDIKVALEIYQFMISKEYFT
jgi:hypothetical protein